MLNQVESHNNDFAIRLRDIFVAGARRRIKISGRGNENKLTANHTARVVFGRGFIRPTFSKRLRVVKKTKSVPRNQLASSDRGLAACYAASHWHIQRLRDGIALQFMKGQVESLSKLPEASIATLELSFDEAEEIAIHDKILGLYDLLMIHARLFLVEKATGNVKIFEIISSPQWLKGKTAAHVLNGILRALPFNLARLGHIVTWLHVVVLSDAA